MVEGIPEAEMPKMKNYIILAILMCLSIGPKALSSGWAWVEREVAPVPWDYTAYPMFMIYDKSDQKLTLLINYESSHTVQVWKFSPPNWIKEWEGTPDIGDISRWYYFRYMPNMYFDDNLNSIVIWGYCPGYQFETGCHALFKYVPGEGFIRITDCIPITTVYDETYPNFSIAFDTQRRRAVFVGGFVMYLDGAPRFVTIEYDGTKLYYIRNNPEPPENILFAVGTSGYDPCTNRVVFYGQRRMGYPFETWEYNGQTWTQVPVAEGPPMDGYPVIGMTYVPELGGLLALPNDVGPIDSWVYRKKQWGKISVITDFKSLLGLLTIDYYHNVLVFYGGDDTHGFINQMREFRCAAHCKPLSRP
jgi:hypothetical protein